MEDWPCKRPRPRSRRAKRSSKKRGSRDVHKQETPRAPQKHGEFGGRETSRPCTGAKHAGMGPGGRAYFRWVLGQCGRRAQQCRSGTEIGSVLRASLPLCGGEGANRRREASFRASVEGFDSFEARVSPVLRCRRLSSHRTPTWNARFGRSKCTIAAKVPT